jgi:hypothetical protein
VTEWVKEMERGKGKEMEKEMVKVKVLEKVMGLVQVLELHNPR